MPCIHLVFSVTRMNKNGIAVYTADTKALLDDTAFQTAYRMVSPERRRKTDSFIFRKDKMLSLAAGLLLQQGLRRCGIVGHSISCGIGGKPYLADPVGEAGRMKSLQPLYFNLSHSEEKVMCVISDAEVGCDVEKIAEIDLAVARRYFFTTEYETIAEGETPEQRRELFYRLWTLKESFMKATGLGMTLPLDAFRVELERPLQADVEHRSAVLFHSVNEKRYRFREYDLGDGYKYAICGTEDGGSFPSDMEYVELSQLLRESR